MGFSRDGSHADTAEMPIVKGGGPIPLFKLCIKPVSTFKTMQNLV